ncbi:putative hydrolase (plasmid) [Paraburkholderia caribensis MBA4]|uniref:Putative hydrolase n=1 Tax=Paraburkholderia caribensis MBA4 TaxID=1323664 RepID=A0A0P0RP95_9BURK|nr:alpha/beta hydrolase [Paraburkholderia caribensis]ALL70747.1 putative hydrolase [Paraburkholderia caribensis MBA4]
MVDTKRETLELRVRGANLSISTIFRSGTREPILFLHGFGSTKEDYADIVRLKVFSGRPFIAYDAPGCGESMCSDLSAVDIPFLVETARAVLEHMQVQRFHVVGHSMGGLTSLMLAHEEHERVISFIDIEGNVAPEDCFLSRQIFTHAADDPHEFLAHFIERTRQSPEFSSSLYATSLKHKVRAEAVRSIFTSMVDLSDHGDLMTRYLGLSCKKMFMFGEQNSHLSYLPQLEAAGVKLARISRSGHFLMYSNPVEMWDQIAGFIGYPQPGD